MEAQSLVTKIISDIGALRAVLPKSADEEEYWPPEIVVVYLLANYDLIRFCLRLTYERLTEAQRLELCKDHQELEPVAAKDDFRSIAEDALDLAKSYWNGFNQPQLNDDSLNMLTRGLGFAKYVALDWTGMALLMHPVSNYLPWKESENYSVD